MNILQSSQRFFLTKVKKVDTDNNRVSEIKETRFSICVVSYNFAKCNVARNVDSIEIRIMKLLELY